MLVVYAFRRFTLKDSRKAIVRYVKWEDVDGILDIFNTIAEEEEIVRYLGVVGRGPGRNTPG